METIEKLTHYPMVIGDQLVSSGNEDLVDPATGEVFATVALGTTEEVDRAVTIAREAQVAWGKLSYGERSLALLKFADALEAKSEELARLESQNTGKPLKLSLGGDIPFAIDNLRYFASAVRRQEGTAAGEYLGGYTSMVRREPIGVVGAITPWNYPFMMAIWKLGPALAAGNAVVIKPAPNTPLTTIELAKVALESGLPAGLINVVTGGAEVGEAICTHPGIRMVSFTGSTRTGKRIAELASPLVKRVTLELGGKAPFIVFADADIEAAARGAVPAAYMNTGQDCTAATRIYVQNEVFEQFLDRFVELTKKVRVGNPFDDATDIGPLVSETQRLKVKGCVDEARQQGIRVATGGEVPDGPGFFYTPTILVDAPQSANCVQEEIFGPVIVVNRFSDEAEALQLANDIPYGLAGSVWTLNVQRALRMSAAMECGTVWVNDHLPIASEMPHGGFKQSGIGKDMSHYALEEYTIVKHVIMDISGDQKKAWHSVVLDD
ncbi:aminobutyraldehyde dehydrogenase [Oculatella sp. LEGE 06141]|uniref:aminobutyraldehyde dehydrogenase n=1 Tax=Oculatella sp. LEGE 06141 TaxID=1828648 RepID=UPI00187F25DC|nr:aminobutyraldehyde dehydrogenase [Oculatella sp. LEGE 06141]MBE9180106.1 aminobutyraldehyde dehydrogenase [Oculatella sp. LEGE 06141]